MTSIKRILVCFELVSGLKLDLKKTGFFGVNVDDSHIQRWASNLNCTPGTFPTDYLGLLLGCRNNSASIWYPIIEKFQNRLAYWKSKFLSTGGRLRLVKSVLSSLPIFYLSLFQMPTSVNSQLNNLIAEFIGGATDKRAIHWVKWDHLCLPKLYDGPGIIDLKVNPQQVALEI